MPQIANQDYNVIDFTQLPYYEAVERLYRAYLQGTVFDCVVKQVKAVCKIIEYGKSTIADSVFMSFNKDLARYVLKTHLTTDEGGYLMLAGEINVVSADGFKLKPVLKDNVLTGVEITTEKMENNVPAQYFKDWMIGQPVGGG